MGGDYFSFVLIGIAFSDYLGVGLGSFAGTIREGQMLGTLEAMLVTPTRVHSIILFSSIWQFLLTSIRVLAYILLGVFFPITILPGWLQKVSYFLPITYSLRAMRHALLQSYSFQALGFDILILALFSVVLLPFSIYAFKVAVRRAKKDGSLTHY